MSIHYDVQILRSKLIAMMRLTQRTVNYSIKAMELGRPELCHAVHNSKGEMSALGCWLATRGRKLLETGISADSARFACAALRISGALESAYNAVVKIAQQIQTRSATGWTPVTAELEDAGQFVNSLLRLCFPSLLNRDIQHAKAVLHSAGAEQSLDLAVYLTHHGLAQRTRAEVRFELSIIRCLNEIADQRNRRFNPLLVRGERTGKRDTCERRAQTRAPYREVSERHVSGDRLDGGFVLQNAAFPGHNPIAGGSFLEGIQ